MKESPEREEIRTMIMHFIQEQHRCIDIIDSVRKKCEDERKVSK